jgi:DNA-binding ferritin-like protein (Dps family)
MSDHEIHLTSQQLLDNLQKDWKAFPERFNALTPEQRSAYLKTQGYDSLHDLLAHILAWWEEAVKIVNSILDNMELPRKEYDIDAFNKSAIDHFQTWKDEDMLIHFENVRQSLVNLIVDLPESGLHNSRINGWLKACVVEHFQEHVISE